MCHESPSDYPIRLRFARSVLGLWPFLRGRGWLSRPFLYDLEEILESLPNCASFSFRYGRFVDAPLGAWPTGYRELFLYGLMEIDEVSVWSRILKPGATVVDGGSNYGYWSLVAAHFVGSSGEVHAFEPVQHVHQALQANCSASRRHNIIVHNSALSDHSGESWINYAENDPIGGQSSLASREDVVLPKKMQCHLVTLDEVIQQRPVRLIKLDIEGAELAALRGSIRILEREEKPVVTFEWNRATAKGFGYDPSAIQEFLSEFGYTFSLATRTGLIPFKERIGQADWVPMVWALTEAHRRELGI